MNNIKRIVLTGGPCAGKTTALIKVIEHFNSLGYQVFTIPEVPTMFSQAGMNYLTRNKALFYEGEKATLEVQLALEDKFMRMAEACEQPAIIVCDRGTMDISAYMEPEMWQEITQGVGTDPQRLRDGRYDDIKTACRSSLEALATLKTRFPEDILGMTIAFGSDAWKAFGHAEEGSEIKPFPVMGNGLAPATQHDIYIHIQAYRQNAAFALAQSVLAAFGDSISVATEEHGLRLYEERGLDGFVDGTENPQGDENVRNVAIIPEGRPDAGGSYVLLQKYLHDLKKWDAVPVAEQEASVSRSKEANEEFSKDVRLPDSHLGRVNLKENGVGLKIVRRSLPFGKISGEHGLMFTAYCHTLHNIEVQLLHMFGDADGKTDLLLKHLSTAVSGAYYYAPSVERLQDL